MSKFDKTFQQFMEAKSGLDLSKELNDVYDAKDLEGKQKALLELLKKLKKPTKINELEKKYLPGIISGNIKQHDIEAKYSHLFNGNRIDQYATNVVLKGQGMGTLR